MYYRSRSYFESSKSFTYSILFILPYLLVYEFGLFRGVLGKNINGADAILRLFFYFLYGVLGVATTRVLAGILIFALVFFAFRHIIKNHIRIRLKYFLFMFLESIVLGFLLGILVHFSLNREFPELFSFAPNPSVVEQLAIAGIQDFWTKIVAAVGAGIFEEFVFRVLLIYIFYSFWKDSRFRSYGTDNAALVKSAFFSSIIFTLAHVGSVATVFGLVSIFIGSVILSAIYATRGYGIASGAHIFYDVSLMFGILS